MVEEWKGGSLGETIGVEAKGNGELGRCPTGSRDHCLVFLRPKSLYSPSS